MRQRCPRCVFCLGFPEADSCRLHGLIALLRHISPHDACVVIFVLCVSGGVHILWELFVYTHSWRRRRFNWRACHCNPMQGIFLRLFFLPCRWWYRGSAPGSWGYVGRVVSIHIWFQSHQQLRQIEWGATYGSRYQVSWLPLSILFYQDVCAGGHYQV